ncbi:hypothetical protein SAMN05421852_102212 [Thermoflavimicrobium dichotomicum]|uniref:HicA toxin of toxin-antitoxin n=1 Tax=Thermoflavimicrobium dichotomicum TaxID=46223 RepID=A0A1I3LIT4_9BACL|nr:hypothetical protein SAMN05421852_102212 [Thermoflavimicrobium dichotomicum]
MPTGKELKRYCERDGWELIKVTDHYYFQKVLDNGEVLMTKVSMGSGEIRKNLWRQILKKQLRITQEEFNSKI